MAKNQVAVLEEIKWPFRLLSYLFHRLTKEPVFWVTFGGVVLLIPFCEGNAYCT